MRNYHDKHNLLIICTSVPDRTLSAGDYRIELLCNIYKQFYNVYILPFNDCKSKKLLSNLKKKSINIIFAENREEVAKLIKKYNFKAVIFEWYQTILPFIAYLPLMNRVIIDTNELQYLRIKRSGILNKNDLNNRGYISLKKNNEFSAYKLADVLISISDKERDLLKAKFPKKNVVTIPTWIDETDNKANTVFEKRKDFVFLGQFRKDRSDNIDAVKYFINEIFPLIVKKVPGAKFHIAGSDIDGLKTTLNCNNNLNIVFDNIGRQNIFSYLKKFRVFVCPLRVGSGLKKKVLDGIVSGCPVITTPIGVEGYDLINNKEIIIASKPADFAVNCIKIYNNKSLWCKISKSALKKIRKLHLDETGGNYYRNILKKIVS